jgi:23S rRNA pseudouridine1911/1915/1917 synthase
MRLDSYLAQHLEQLTRSRLHSLINEGHVLLNGGAAKPAQQVRAGDAIAVTMPPPRPIGLSAEPIPVPVVFEDDDVVVVDKPAGLAVHPGPGHPDGTLVNALLALCPGIQGVGGALRPGIVHRLDKDTSGLMVVAKNDAAHHGLSDSLKTRRVVKGYLGLAAGSLPQPEGVIDLPIARHPRNRKKMAVVEGGKPARTRYRVTEELPGVTLLELDLETGRTHQIRVHLAHLGNPLIGDAVYGRAEASPGRQFLHASRLGFEHPATGAFMEFHSGLPDGLAESLARYRGEQGSPSSRVF